MTTTTQPQFGEAVKADRQRRKMTQKQYAELTGVSAGKIQGAEAGRKPKQETIESLVPFIGELVDNGQGEQTMVAQGVHEGAYDQVVRGIQPGEDYEAAKARLIARFEALQQRLGDKPAPPYGMPSQYRIDACPPEEWPSWDAWMERVEQYLNEIEGGNVPAATESRVAEAEVNEEIGYSGAVPWSEIPGSLEHAEQSVADARQAVQDVFPPGDVPVWLPEFDDEDEPELIVATGAVYNPELSTEFDTTIPPEGDQIEMFPDGPSQTPLEELLRRSVDAVRDGGALQSGTVVESGDPAFEVGAQILAFPTVTLEPPVRRQLDVVELEADKRYITNGELQTFKECKRRWWLEYYRAIGPAVEKRTGAAALGTRVHKALSVIYVPEGESPGDPLAELDWTIADDRQYMEQAGANDAAFKELEKEHDLARAIIEGYLQWLEEEAADAGLVVVSAEQPLIADPKFPKFEHVRLLVKQDVRVRQASDGAHLFLDHKVTQNFPDLESWAHMNPQMKHYGLAEFLAMIEDGLGAGHDPGVVPELRTDGAVLNMLRKVKRTATAKPPFFKRHHIRWNMDTLRNYWRDVLSTLTAIEAAKLQLNDGQDHHMVVPPTPTRDCSWKCPFFLHCPMFDDGSHVEAMVAETTVSVNPWQRYEPELRDILPS